MSLLRKLSQAYYDLRITPEQRKRDLLLETEHNLVISQALLEEHATAVSLYTQRIQRLQAELTPTPPTPPAPSWNLLSTQQFQHLQDRVAARQVTEEDVADAQKHKQSAVKAIRNLAVAVEQAYNQQQRDHAKI